MTQEKTTKILSYKGNLTFEIIEDLLFQFKEKIKPFDVEVFIQKRLYSILVECLENTYRHNSVVNSKSKHAQVELFLINNSDNFVIRVGNFISNNKISSLIKRIKLVNSLDKEGLNNLYRKSISKAMISDKGGAGLGIIEIARNSKQEIKYELMSNEKDFTFFNFLITINKI